MAPDGRAQGEPGRVSAWRPTSTGAGIAAPAAGARAGVWVGRAERHGSRSTDRRSRGRHGRRRRVRLGWNDRHDEWRWRLARTSPDTRAHALSGTGPHPPSTKVALVESLDLHEHVPACQDARARQPVNGQAWSFASAGIDHHVPSRRREIRQEPACHGGSSEQPGQHVGVAARASLRRPIRIQNSGADDGVGWRSIELVQQRPNAPATRQQSGLMMSTTGADVAARP